MVEVNKGKLGKVDKLREQRGKLNARIQKLEAGEKSRERKRETRRKILVGAYYLDKAKEDGKLDAVDKLMDGYLNRKSDRVLFDLPILETENEDPACVE